MKLIIVESPTKARTIAKFLGPGYAVASSYGHIRDLPSSAQEIPAKFKKEAWARLGVNPDDGYAPLYVVSKDSRSQVEDLKKLLKKADEVLLATDEDREGEAISWHLLEVLRPQVPVRRITFHEVTKGAIEEALRSPRDVDMQLVRAQEGRRILDRLFGYSLSPVLWKKVRTKLSAGRVQSVAVRLVVEREKERQAFRTAQYFDVEALLVSGDLNFTARLATVDGRRLAGGKDFDPDTGFLRQPGQRLHLDEELARTIAADTRQTLPWRVAAVELKETTQRPVPPFTTSTLQQAASGKLRLSPQRVMRIAQRLYEGVALADGNQEGLITYMRTDSLTISEKALQEAAGVIAADFGPEYTGGPRRYRTQSKGAQEAHEAIRPTSFARTPESLAPFLEAEELAVYRLIYNRALASQMTDAKLDKTAVDLAVTAGGRDLVFRANGSIVRFPGFLRVFGDADRDTLLPDFQPGLFLGGSGAEGPVMSPAVDIQDVAPLRHETQPPARYTEASLIKKLEEEGIGRPSTYASVISTIQTRDYVVKKSGSLLPTYIGIAVTQLLIEHFPRYVDIKFTASMEENLDRIAGGEVDLVEFLDCFYRGCAKENDQGLAATIAQELDRIEFPRIEIGSDPSSGAPIVLRIGRNYVSVHIEGEDDGRATLPVDLLIDELTSEKALSLIHQKRSSREPIGKDPASGKDIYALVGPFGPYLQLGEQEGDAKPKRIGLGPQTDPSTIDLPTALRLLSLPREIGVDPETGKAVRAGLGRFGPYVERDRVFANVGSVETLFTITLQEALERIRSKNRRPVLREVGVHPESGAPLQILKGRYGPYVTDGVCNATLGKDRDPEEVTLEECLSLLKAAREKGPSPRSGRGRGGRRAAGGGQGAKSSGKASSGKSTGKKKASPRKKTAAKKTAGGAKVTRTARTSAAGKKATTRKGKTSAAAAGAKGRGSAGS